MRAFAIGVLAMACGGDPAAEPAPASEAGDDAPAVAAAAEASWLTVVRNLRVDMRVGRAAAERGSPIDAVEAAVRAAGGTLGCADLTWVSDEDGVSEAQCVGSIPIEGTDGIVIANLRQYELPGEPTEPGLLSLSLGGPFLGNDDAIGPWLTAVRAELEPHYGAPENAANDQAADLRWRTPDRLFVLHDPLRAPCGGECNAFLWMGGPEDPTARIRGF